MASHFMPNIKQKTKQRGIYRRILQLRDLAFCLLREVEGRLSMFPLHLNGSSGYYGSFHWWNNGCTPILDLGGQIQSATIKVQHFFFRGDTGNLQARLFPWNTWCRIRPDAVKSFQSSIHVISLTWTPADLQKADECSNTGFKYMDHIG